MYDLAAEDSPKRYVHGLALADRFQRYVTMLKEVHGVEVHLHQGEVTDLEELPDGELGAVVGDGAPVLDADYVLMLTGHSSNDPARYPRQASPVRREPPSYLRPLRLSAGERFRARAGRPRKHCRLCGHGAHRYRRHPAPDRGQGRSLLETAGRHSGLSGVRPRTRLRRHVQLCRTVHLHPPLQRQGARHRETGTPGRVPQDAVRRLRRFAGRPVTI
ncbi:FAD/NAD(P)-binding protein [Streptomyces cyaneofuscatus]|uniref:FAD/NAD(P)-binding protein n=1 Tax=Streptomyces cyaneofuscatus TaxID=66883 RepID=UPI0036849EC7